MKNKEHPPLMMDKSKRRDAEKENKKSSVINFFCHFRIKMGSNCWLLANFLTDKRLNEHPF